MAGFLASFSSEIRPLIKKKSYYQKDAIGKTERLYGPQETISGILFTNKDAKLKVSTASRTSTGFDAVLANEMTATLYVTLDVELASGDIVVDGSNEWEVKHIEDIYVFGGVLDHRQAVLYLAQ